MPDYKPDEGSVEEVFEKLTDEFEIADNPIVDEATQDEEPKVEEKPPVPLQVFLQLCGVKWDRSAGFKYYATKQKLGPMSIPNWHKEFQKFLDRPV